MSYYKNRKFQTYLYDNWLSLRLKFQGARSRINSRVLIITLEKQSKWLFEKSTIKKRPGQD